MKDRRLVLVISLILLCFFIYQQLHPKKVIQEGYFWDDIVDSVKHAFEVVIEELKKAFKKVADAITGVFNQIVDAFDKIAHQFNVLPIRINRIISGFDKSQDAIGMEFKNLGIALNTGFDDTFDLIGDGGKMVIEYVLCGLDKLLNLPLCIIFYLFDMFRTMFGWFFRSLVCAVEVYFDAKRRFGIDLDDQIDAGKKRMMDLDDYVSKITKFHIFRYPEYIERHCYACNMKTVAKQLADEAKQVNYDFNHYLPDLMKQPAYLFREAGHDFHDVVDPNL